MSSDSTNRISLSASVPAMIATNSRTSYWWALSLLLVVLAATIGLAYSVY
jgi:hypothetical protein